MLSLLPNVEGPASQRQRHTTLHHSTLAFAGPSLALDRASSIQTSSKPSCYSVRGTIACCLPG